jgi:RHS repeat-associated protein
MNLHYLTRIAFLSGTKRLGGVCARGEVGCSFSSLLQSDCSEIVRPAHPVTNTYEADRNIITTKQNRVTTGPNTNAIVSQYDYTVNAIGQRTTRTQSGTAFDGIGYAPGTQLPPTMTGTPGSGTTTDTFTYNPRGEVISSINNVQSSHACSYNYDPIGNRLATTEGELSNPATAPNAKTYTSSSLNQYTQINTTLPIPPTTAQPTYDDDDNLLTDGTGKTYTWDCENRLTQVTLPNNELVKYYYNAGSHRVKREHITATNTTTTIYLYDSWNVIHERTTNSTPTESTPATSTTTCHWGLDLSNTLQGAGGVGGLLHSKTTSGDTLTNNATFLHSQYLYDANGNVTDLLTPTGTHSAHYEYDPFGNTLPPTAPSAQENPYRFSTKPYDEKTELYYYGYRFYCARIGRWLNRDPLGELGVELMSRQGGRVRHTYAELLPDGPSLYSFVRNNPVFLIDGDGRAIPPAVLAVIAIMAAAEACAVPQALTAHERFSDSGDKFKHCWVSCRISKTCGGLVTELAGLGKEVIDRAKGIYCDYYPESDICKHGHGDFWDSIDDLIANQQCIGWESIFGGPVGGWIGALCRRSCEDCCREKVGYHNDSGK